jgi:hypothetical protein
MRLLKKYTNCWVLILRRLTVLVLKTRIITDTSRNHNQVDSQHIYDKLRPERASALLGFMLSPGVTPQDKSVVSAKKSGLKVFVKVHLHITEVYRHLCIGDDPSVEVIQSCKGFYCMQLSSKEDCE